MTIAYAIYVGIAKLTAVGPSVGDFVELLPLLALPEYELLLVPDFPLFDDDDDDASYVTKSPKAAVLVDLLADEFDDEPTPTPMAVATSAAINRNPRTTSFFF